ncbi:MAG: RNA polymerase subunit sigma-70 [Myxococcales bacterium]|nr:RNA polymerase subunit sigma-70 [Myxococcales bacterium]
MSQNALLQHNPLDQYMGQVKSIPLLSREEEEEAARAFVETGDPRQAERLVLANLRFVVRIAHEYRGYGMRLLDLIQEGNMGLMNAVQKFDPDRGYRLVSYAVWWIRAYIQDYVMRSYSLVKMGTTQAQRKLFFSGRKVKRQLEQRGEDASREAIAEAMGLKVSEVDQMEVRMARRDYSLDAPISAEDDGGRLIDVLPAEQEDPESIVTDRLLQEARVSAVGEALEVLDERERRIIGARDLAEEPMTLAELGEELGVSRERARQLEARGRQKIRGLLEQQGAQILAPD